MIYRLCQRPKSSSANIGVSQITKDRSNDRPTNIHSEYIGFLTKQGGMFLHSSMRTAILKIPGTPYSKSRPFLAGSKKGSQLLNKKYIFAVRHQHTDECEENLPSLTEVAAREARKETKRIHQ